MSDLSVSERRIRPIQDAVASENWKQALQLCDKWAKKGERSDRFLAVKASVLVHQSDKAQHDRGRQEVLDLCKRTPPITDSEAIYQLQKTLKSLSLHEEIPKLWERAVAAGKDNKDLYTRWLNQAIADSNWRSAQKATMGLRNSFPKERQYEFWNILMCYLIHKQEDIPENERMLFGTLAYRMISKAAEAIPKDEEPSLSSAKAISDPEEIALLVQVFNSTGHVQESIKLLLGGSLSIESRLGAKDPQLVLSLVLESLEASENWNEALKVCLELLAKSESQSDNRVWDLWLKARSHATDQSLQKQSEDLLESICTTRPIVRSAYIAKLSLLQRQQGDQIGQDALLQTCREYSEAFSEKAFCFDDLKDALRRLDKQHWDEFLRIVQQRQGHFAQLFALKVVYSSIPAADSEPPHARNQKLLAFAHRALKLYHLSIAEPPSCPEAALLAALAILHLQIQDPQHQQVLVAANILEIARSKFEDYYILTVLLVRLQAHLGLLSLAMQNFTKLSIKNMQWETVGHLILTRISTLHPGFNGVAGDLEPLLAAETGVTVLENADMALVRGIREGLRFNSYSNIYNSAQMRSDIERSMNKQICAIEERRVSRWRGPQFDDATVLPPMDPSKALVDKRDYSYMPSYSEDDRRMLESCHCGNQPKGGWVNAMVLCDNVTTYLKQDLVSHTTPASAAYKNIKEFYERFSANTSMPTELEKEMTSSEVSTFDAATNMAQAIILLSEGQPGISGASKSLPDIVAHIKSSITSELDSRRKDKDASRIAGMYIPWWNDLHTSFSELEKLQTISHFLTWVSRKLQKGGKPLKAVLGAVTKESLSELQSLVAELEAENHAHARWMKSQINEPGVLGKLVDIGMARPANFPTDADVEAKDGNGSSAWLWNEPNTGSEWEQVMEDLCDEATMETIYGRYRESWDDALDGILMTRVRVLK
ncbi:hypothetical protein A1O7_01651 [Cladophialophora yegresii CBS 114405]|uniref:Uncharacterized protein n=1 Tax=Cladophialophora yegresii CBS 114405 TaxID=1182544 RepID=W9WK02_9EURO|nr:uncharacterized protein A1O7_01651 [Cladophialophora yegresii CBS 114405]EXJ65310.1 hypothetical protein A1O7_01651 [Cladophialophora yegresii CBS 114405]